MENKDNNEAELNAMIDNNEDDLNGADIGENIQLDDESNEIDKEEVIHNTEEETAFLNSLNTESENIEADLAVDVDEAFVMAQGELTGTMLLGVSEGLIKQLGHSDFSFDQAQKEQTAKTFAPLFKKYGGELPPWLTQYKEELMFLFAVGGLGFSSVVQIKALKKADAEKQAAEKNKSEAVEDAANQPE